ncbi:SDR family oxidoreductase [Terriglobus aquaticus]|uniref:SDR family oxidoreductase n=1 Tax=Terriglobus aquaticus TaxID=940139 RepID=A0ABW9KGK2_9BACT|nr:SDR family oxidoreductase [Terriglobus aquaticus]
MDLHLQGRVAVVCGASKGIGLAIAQALAAEGVSLALCARGTDALKESADAIRAKFGVEVEQCAVDVRDDGALRAFVQWAAAHFGRLDIAVPNAGGPPAKSFLETTTAEWDAAFASNLRSVVAIAQAAIPHMQRGRFGRIVAVTSYTSKQPAPGLVISNALRPGVAGLLRSLSNEFAKDGITANAVGPGYVDSERTREVLRGQAALHRTSYDDAVASAVAGTPSGRMATLEEVAATAVWLCSAQAASTTGQTILVDGGSYRGL